MLRMQFIIKVEDLGFTARENYKHFTIVNKWDEEIAKVSKKEVNNVEYYKDLEDYKELSDVIAKFASTPIHKRKIKLTFEERELLESLNDKWTWIARDGDGELNAHDSEPSKTHGDFWSNGDTTYKLPNEMFTFIDWEDIVPHRVGDILYIVHNLKSYEGL